MPEINEVKLTGYVKWPKVVSKKAGGQMTFFHIKSDRISIPIIWNNSSFQIGSGQYVSVRGNIGWNKTKNSITVWAEEVIVDTSVQPQPQEPRQYQQPRQPQQPRQYQQPRQPQQPQQYQQPRQPQQPQQPRQYQQPWQSQWPQQPKWHDDDGQGQGQSGGGQQDYPDGEPEDPGTWESDDNDPNF